MNRSELANLTAFVEIADNLSFRAAAKRLGVEPSALSHTMRELEERLGVRLLNRTTRSVSPTDAGLRLLEQLRPAVEQISRALKNLESEQEHPVGRLRLMCTISPARRWSPTSGRAFCRHFPTSSSKSTAMTRRLTSWRRASMPGLVQRTGWQQT